MGQKKIQPKSAAELIADNNQMLQSQVDDVDRARVLIAGASLEQSLLSLLATRFKPGSITDSLLNDNGPIGSVMMRAQIAYVLGLIPDDAYTDLKELVRVRNYFAHKHGKPRFSDSVPDDACKKLKILTAAVDRDMPGDPAADALRYNNSVRFFLTAKLICNNIVSVIEEAESKTTMQDG